MSTRSIHLAPGVERERAENEGTVVMSLPALRVRTGRTGAFFLSDLPEASFAELFRAHFDALAEAHARHARERGVLIAAVVPGFGLRGHVWLAAGESLRAAIVGRHERADLHLPDDPALSLRHLAVLVRAGGDRVRVRVMDLRTGTRFRDEAGRELSAVAADGPLFVRASAHRFFLLPTGPGCALAGDADAAWEALPPRRFADEREEVVPAARPVAWADGSGVFVSAGVAATVVTAQPALAPPELVELVAPGEPVLGQLVVRTRGRATVVSLGASRASRGVLLGRYDRCDGVCPAGWFSEAVSRVHAFLLLDDGVLHVVDAGSTNGTTLRGAVVRCEPIPTGERVDLPEGSLEWIPAQ